MMLIILIDEKKGLFSKDFMQFYHPINLAAFIHLHCLILNDEDAFWRLLCPISKEGCWNRK